MISSEVQRTLVKSPPELWTELSDPEALARHLGELGEIKITRMEPEKLVEWEAEGTTGTVAIKASGWGTRVTLTVERELAEPEAAAIESDEIAAETPEADTLESGTPEANTPEASPARDEIAEGPATAGTWVDAQDHKPAPATEAARRAAGWPVLGGPAGPAIESDLRAAEAAVPIVEPLSPEGEDLPSDRELSPRDVEPEELDGTSASAAEAEPESRRGFFARLFGRRRKQPTAAGNPGDPDAGEEPGGPALTLEPISPGASSLSDAEPPGPRALADPGPIADPVPVAVQEPPAGATPIAVEEAEATDGPVAAPGPGDEHATASEEVPGQHPGHALAAELKAAEEAAAEQVEAVLTGVLDRLGAAHHRPFSRA